MIAFPCLTDLDLGIFCIDLENNQLRDEGL